MPRHTLVCGFNRSQFRPFFSCFTAEAGQLKQNLLLTQKLFISDGNNAAFFYSTLVSVAAQTLSAGLFPLT